MSVVISLRMADVQELHLEATGLETLRALAGTRARPLGHDRTAEYAFLAVEAARSYVGLTELTRQFIFLADQKALVEYDIAVPSNPPVQVSWKLEGAGTAVSLLPERKLASEVQFLHLVQMGGRQTPGRIESDDLAGLRLGAWAILFHTEARMARSAVSFDVEGPAQMKFLVAGLAPGTWEIWHAGMRELNDGMVPPESGILHFEGKPGSYFLRAM